MSSDGYGIAGHKNTYKTGVRCGNWVEDTIGMDLVKSGHRNPDHFQTESQANFQNPRKRGVAGPPRGPTAPAAAASSMPAHLLFSHGLTPHDPAAGEDSRFATMTGTLFGESKTSTAEVLADHPKPRVKQALAVTRRDMSKEKSKEARREMKASFVTEASATMRGGKPTGPKAKGRDGTFTREFNKGIKGLRQNVTVTKTSSSWSVRG